jgi:hypothetical protein
MLSLIISGFARSWLEVEIKLLVLFNSFIFDWGGESYLQIKGASKPLQ